MQYQKYTAQQEEMATFSHILSHAIKGPLHAMQKQIAILQESPENREEISREFCTNLLQSTTHVTHLCDVMVDYARIAAGQGRKKQLNGQTIASNVLQRLHQHHPSSKTAVKVAGRWPDFYGCDAQLITLFYKILSNACIFNIAKKPNITLSFSETPTHYCANISDNGIGVDDAHHEIIFVLFQRCAQEYHPKGVGAGLALSKKIAQAHGGDVRLTSSSSQGSNFFLSILKKPSVEIRIPNSIL